MPELITILFCILANSFLALTEMAFVSIGKAQLKELSQKGNRNAQRLLRLRENPERTLSVLQIGISLLAAIAATTGGVSMEEVLSPYLEKTVGLSESTAEILGILAVVLPITYLSVVIGELVPKTLALRNPLKIALKSARWLYLADKILMPLVTLLEWSTKKVLKLFFPRSRQESQETNNESLTIANLSEPHQKYILNLVNIENKKTRDILVPFQNVISIKKSFSSDEVNHSFIESGYTRLPVMENEAVVGILHSKEFMAFRQTPKEDWHSLIRKAPRVRSQDSLLFILRLIQENRSQMVMVEDENKIKGIVTLEDILEEIIGDVFDEDEDKTIRHILSTGSVFRRR